MEGWTASTLEKACDMYQPKTITANEMTPIGRYPVYGANGVIGRYDQFNHEEPQLLITCRGATCGSVNVSAPQAWITGNAMVVRPKTPAIELRFLEYLFRGGLDISRAITGAAQPQITRANLNPIKFRYPISIPEQRRIVAVLDEAFEAIATAKANTEKNMQNAREIFTTVRVSIFTAGSGAWPIKTLPELAQNLDSKRVPITKSDRNVGEFPYYGASGIVDYVADYIFDGDTLLISEDGANLLARSTPIAFSVSGRYWVNNHAHILKFNDMATQRFVELFLESIPLDKYITGAAQPKLNQKALNSIPIPIPVTGEQQRQVVDRLDVLAEQSEALQDILERKHGALDELKKSLLHQAFTGALTDKSTDKQVAEIA